MDTKENRLKWFRRLPKRQVGSSGPSSFNGYQAFKKGDRHFFIYNDHANNHLQEGPPKRIEEYTMWDNTAVIMMMVNSSGEVKKHELIPPVPTRAQLAVYPARIWEINNNKNILICSELLAIDQNFSKIHFNFAWDKYLE